MKDKCARRPASVYVVRKARAVYIDSRGGGGIGIGGRVGTGCERISAMTTMTRTVYVCGCVRACANSSSAHSCGVLWSAGEMRRRSAVGPHRFPDDCLCTHRIAIILYTAFAMSHTLL